MIPGIIILDLIPALLGYDGVIRNHTKEYGSKDENKNVNIVLIYIFIFILTMFIIF